ncbi:fimbrial protein PefA [Citrobacter arsenatis]|uniref:fimbrial protein PefA n=1 Tax=Citrobacter arsenatis TaxID=2546350 RepID=UPI00300DCCA2
MKKNLLAVSALALAVMSGSAMAANGEVQFLGVVTDVTCDLIPETGGAVNNLVQLGTVAKNTAGTAVDFTLKADGNQAGCQGLTGKATIGWAGPFSTTGLKAQSGLATDAWTKISTVNADTTAVQDITSSKLSTQFDATLLTSDGAKFKAQLNGGAIVGDYQSAAAFVVAYN